MVRALPKQGRDRGSNPSPWTKSFYWRKDMDTTMKNLIRELLVNEFGINKNTIRQEMDQILEKIVADVSGNRLADIVNNQLSEKIKTEIAKVTSGESVAAFIRKIAEKTIIDEVRRQMANVKIKVALETL